ncbi:kinase-regulated stress-responsive transcription factor skn7 [Rhizina undulata]
MLEDPSHKDIVRWSETGDSFIVVDTNDFTKNILPRHFKHSNFASFVRQLNKYDFHKIRNHDEGGSSNQHGDQAWEFRHPDFQMHRKDNLDNIKRKTTASRKQQQPNADIGPQQIEELQNQIRDIANSQTELNAQLQRVNTTSNTLVNEMQHVHIALQHHETQIQNHEAVMQKLIQFLWKLDQEVRSLRQAVGIRVDQPQRDRSCSEAVSQENGNAGSTTSATSPNEHNGPSTPLQQAQRLMNGYPEMPKPSSSLQHIPEIAPVPASTPESAGIFDPSGTVDRPLQNGQRQNAIPNGIPAHDEGIMYGMNPPATAMGEVYSNGQSGNIGYAVNTPQAEVATVNTPDRPASIRKRSATFIPNWTTAPRILLVEDDATCARIGTKFLQSAQCAVDTANDGLIALEKLSTKKYDLVLMDIVMPNLDGVSAASLIRQFDKATPIIAMTSNIRRDDINTYFHNGMNDVLPKPFTKDGLLQMLEKILGHLKSKDAGQIPPQLSCSGPETRLIEDQTATIPKTFNNLKFSTSPAKSPLNGNPYGRSPNDQGDDQAEETPSTVDDSGYLHIMGSYSLENNGNPHDTGNNFPAQQPIPPRGIRRAVTEMDEQHHLSGVDKKLRY